MELLDTKRTKRISAGLDAVEQSRQYELCNN